MHIARLGLWSLDLTWFSITHADALKYSNLDLCSTVQVLIKLPRHMMGVQRCENHVKD
jgi:hypothetical protein